MLLMLQLIENEIHYCALPVRELLETVSKTKELAELDFVSSCSEKYTVNGNFSETWRLCLAESACGLNEDDKKLLCSFGDALGTTDVTGQIHLCRLHARLLEERLERAQQEKEQQGKMYTNLGTLTGVFLAVILI